MQNPPTKEQKAHGARSNKGKGQLAQEVKPNKEKEVRPTFPQNQETMTRNKRVKVTQCLKGAKV